MVRPGRQVDPDPRAVARYEELYQQYEALYPAAREVLGR